VGGVRTRSSTSIIPGSIYLSSQVICYSYTVLAKFCIFLGLISRAVLLFVIHILFAIHILVQLDFAFFGLLSGSILALLSSPLFGPHFAAFTGPRFYCILDLSGLHFASL